MQYIPRAQVWGGARGGKDQEDGETKVRPLHLEEQAGYSIQTEGI